MSQPVPPPTDYLGYISKQASYGAVLSDEKTIEVDGHPGMLLTATAKSSLDGVLGCPLLRALQHENCFGLTPRDVLRMSVVVVDGLTVIAWARTQTERQNTQLLLEFEEMLSKIEFR